MTQVGSTQYAPSVPQVVATDCTYNEVPYPSYPVAATHPDRLYGVAKLFGLNPVPPHQARILEIGCAGGGNLIPIASQFPHAKCVGIELSAVQVENGRIATKFLGLNNIEIKQGSVTDITSDLGRFDYILCHGVFSWVPDLVRDSILKVASQNLSESGVAFISYNTMPGWYFRGMVREMLLRHVADIKDPLVKIEQARALLSFLVEANDSKGGHHADFIRSEAEFLSKQPDTYLFHEHLEENNKAYFFEDFLALAAKHNLQFLGESCVPTMWTGNLPEGTRKKLESIQDSAKLGHYTDCMVGRMFRETLLVHQECSISRNLDPKRLEEIRFIGRFKQIISDKRSDEVSISYKAQSGHTMTTAQAVCQMTIEAMTKAYPQSVSLDQICGEIEEKSKLDDGQYAVPRQELSTILMEWALAGYIDFRFQEDRLSTNLSGKLKMSSWARAQARASGVITNLRHEMLTVSEVQRQIIPFLDGTRDLNEIATEIGLLLDLKLLSITIDDTVTPANRKALSLQIANQILAELASASMLMADRSVA